ncbi:hypothetical protein EON65_33205, partial [archaeon]
MSNFRRHTQHEWLDKLQRVLGARFIPLLLIACSLAPFRSLATIYTVGTGTTSNTTSGITPFTSLYEDNRIQYLYLASELTAAGASAGTLNSIAFKITALGSPVPTDVSIKVGTVPAATTNINALVTAVTPYYTAATVTPVVGWNTFTFSSGFTWNGTDNIVIEVCRDNNAWSANYGVEVTQLATGVSRTYGFYDDATVGCNMTAGSVASAANRRNRPNMQFDIVSGSACSGTPTAGVATSTVSTTCPNSSFSISLVGMTNGSGISTQWYASAAGANNFAPVTGGNSPALTVTDQTAATDYYAVVTCAGGGTSNSNTVTVGQNQPTQCYCVPTTTNGCASGDHVTLVNALGINNPTGACISASYSDYRNTVAPGSATVGNQYPITVNVANGGTEYAGMWIDYDQSGSFEASEFTALTGTVATVWVYTGNVTIPFSAMTGTTVMRIRSSYSAPIAANSACGTYSYGETEDYFVTIAAPMPCAGTPAPGNTLANTMTFACPGTVNLSLENFTSGTGVSYQWESSADGINWTPVAGETNPTYAAMISATTHFHAIVTCGGSSAASNAVVINVNGVDAGNTISTVPAACSGAFTLSLQNSFPSGSVTYQWESSADGSTWTAIASGTNATYSATQTTATHYRAVVTCLSGGTTSTSQALFVPMGAFYNCYCAAVNGGGTGSMINNLTFGSISNNTAASNPTASPFYSAFSQTTSVIVGTDVPLSISIDAPGSYTGAIGSVWIDYNQDGVYSASEWQQIGTNIVGNTTGTINVSIPATATLGTTGMRVRTRGTGNPNGASDACSSMGSGETEDYFITIAAAAACSGTPDPVTITGPASVCPGTSFSLNAAGFTVASGINYQWQWDSVGTWVNIPGATTASYAATGVNASTSFRFVTSCSAAGTQDVSNVHVVAMNSLLNCYCAASITTQDELISNVTVADINNSSAGFGTSGYESYTTITGTMAAGGSYPFSASLSPFYVGDVVAVWIDLNHDGVLSNPSERVFMDAPGASPVVGTLTIPATAMTGVTLMRVRLDYNNTNPAPCGNTQYGNIEDYLVNIVSCSQSSVSISASTTTVCDGSAASFAVASSTDGGANPTYQWMVNGNPVAGETATTFSAVLANNDVVTVAMTAEGTCAGMPAAISNGFTMTVNPLVTPTVSVNASAATVCAGGTATLTALSTDGGTAPMYTWFMNGSPVSGASGSSYTASGINDGDVFSVDMTSNAGCLAMPTVSSNNVTISTFGNSATISANGSTTICPTGDVTLTAGNGTAYQWSNGATSQSITVNTANTYSVTVTSGNGCVDNSAPVTVSVKTMPGTIKIKNLGATAVCDGNTVPFYIDLPAGSTTGFAYQWNVDGTPIPGATDSTYNADVTGAITLTVTGGSGAGACAKTSSAKNVTIKPNPVASYTVGGATTFCAGGAVTLTADAVTGATFSWLKNGTVNAGSGASKTFNTSGDYALIAKLGGCNDTSAAESVTVYAAPPNSKIKVIGSSAVCEGNTVLISLDPAVSSMGSYFQWNMNGSMITGAEDSTYEADATGSYSLTLITADGCSKTSSVKAATIKPNPVASFTAGGPTTFCAGGSVTLTAPTVTGVTYTWLNNGVSAGSGASKSFKIGGEYSVVAKLSGCTDTFGTETITVDTLPVASVMTMDPTTFCVGESATLEASPTGAGVSYAWYKGTVVDASSTIETLDAMTDGVYKVMVTDANGCVSKLSTTSVKIKTNPIPVA